MTQNQNAQQHPPQVAQPGSGAPWFVWLIFSIVIGLFLFFLLRNSFTKSNTKPKQKTEEKKQAPKSQPSVIDTVITLNPGDTTQRFKTYDGWKVSTGAVGKDNKSAPYQYQSDDNEWKIRGTDYNNEEDYEGGTIRLTLIDSTIRVRVVYRQTN